MTYFRKIQTSPSGTSFTGDANGRQRVSQITTLGDYKQLGMQKVRLMSRAVIGTGLSTYSSPYEVLSTSADGDVSILQTKEFHTYLSGKSHLVEFTTIGFNQEENITKRAGYFSSSTVSPYSANLDGMFLEVNGTEISLNIYNDGVISKQVLSTSFDNQAKWNQLLAATDNLTNFSVFGFDFLWLGGAIFRFWSVVEGEFSLIHTVKWAGSTEGSNKTFTKSPNQPLRLEIRQTGEGSGSFTYVCGQIATEGEGNGKAGEGIDHSITGLSLSTSGTTYLISALRQISTYRDIGVAIDQLNLHSRGNQSVQYALWVNPTITGALSYATVDGTSIEAANGNGSTITVAKGSGYQIFYGSTNSSTSENLTAASYLNRFNHTITGTADVIALVGTPIANNTVVDCGITLREL